MTTVPPEPGQGDESPCQGFARACQRRPGSQCGAVRWLPGGGRRQVAGVDAEVPLERPGEVADVGEVPAPGGLADAVPGQQVLAGPWHGPSGDPERPGPHRGRELRRGQPVVDEVLRRRGGPGPGTQIVGTG